MIATKKMNPSSETENKLRWRGHVKGTPFDFYIPKSCVPEPWPAQIIVLISIVEPGTQPTNHRRHNPVQPIVAFVKLNKLLTQTARYDPEGDIEACEIGHPYIPYEILESVSPGTVPERLRIEVVWDYKAGKWEDKRRVRYG